MKWLALSSRPRGAALVLDALARRADQRLTASASLRCRSAHSR